MKYRLVFVGIDRFSDPQIRDRSGAANDAKDLWALFADTLSDADAQLLVKEEGTATAKRPDKTSVTTSLVSSQI
jgi:helicase